LTEIEQMMKRDDEMLNARLIEVDDEIDERMRACQHSAQAFRRMFSRSSRESRLRAPNASARDLRRFANSAQDTLLIVKRHSVALRHVKNQRIDCKICELDCETLNLRRSKQRSALAELIRKTHE